MTTRLRELLGKATKGPWYILPQQPHVIYGPQDEYIAICNHYELLGAGDEDRNDWLFRKNKANAALIVEAVNTLPALLDALDEARGALEDAEGYSFGNASEKEHAKRREALAKINEVMK